MGYSNIYLFTDGHSQLSSPAHLFAQRSISRGSSLMTDKTADYNWK